MIKQLVTKSPTALLRNECHGALRSLDDTRGNRGTFAPWRVPVENNNMIPIRSVFDTLNNQKVAEKVKNWAIFLIFSLNLRLPKNKILKNSKKAYAAQL